MKQNEVEIVVYAILTLWDIFVYLCTLIIDV